MRSHEPVCSRCGGRHHATNQVAQTSVTRGPGHYPLWVALLCEDCAEKLRDHAESADRSEKDTRVSDKPAAPSPASAAPEREPEWTQEQFREARQMRVDLDTLFFFGPKDDEITLKWCAAIARVSPHFAPRPKVRLPAHSIFHASDGEPLHRTSVIAAALRSAGIEIEGASDEA